MIFLRRATTGVEGSDAFVPRPTLRSIVILLCSSFASCATAPPYPLLPGTTFEPSAAAWDPANERLLVLNDMDGLLYRYAVRDGRVERVEGDFHSPLLVPGGAAKWEALTRLSDGRFLACTAFNRKDPRYRRVVRFAFKKDGPIEAEPIAVDEDALCRAIGSPWFKIEGLAVDGARVYFGVREVGPNYKEPRSVVRILRCPFDGSRIGAPEAVVEFDAGGGGLSDLQRDPADGSWLILTSREDPGNHSGRLYRVSAADFESPGPNRPLPRPLREFRAKSEGLALLPGGRILVVFDDDRDFKKRFRDYAQSDGLYEIFESPR